MAPLEPCRDLRKTANLSLVVAFLLSIAAFADQLFFGQPKWIVVCVLTGYVARLLVLNGRFQDPAVLMMTFAAIYCAVPLALAEANSRATFFLPIDGAAWIYVVGTIGLLVGVAVGGRIFTPRLRFGSPTPMLARAGLLASAVSASLTFVYILKYGMAGITHTYSESFSLRESGIFGVLFLAVPFAAAGLCLTLCSGLKLGLWRWGWILAPYALLFLAHGQRKFIIFPLLFVMAKKVQIKNPAYFIAASLIAIPAFVGFQFAGFTRTNDTASFSDFLDAQGDAMGGEALPVFSTAAAAAESKIDALPLGADYFMAPLMSLPQFLFGLQFLPLNVRFGVWWNADQAADGTGWGFSFFGEAFLVGGYAATLFVPLLITLIFRFLYVRGLASSQIGVMAAISLSMLPLVFWFQRNAFAYLFKEFSYQIAVILLSIAITRILTLCLRVIAGRQLGPNFRT